MLDGGAMFGNVPRALWQKWTDPDDLNLENHERRLVSLALRRADGSTYYHVLFEDGAEWINNGGTTRVRTDANWVPSYPSFVTGSGENKQTHLYTIDAIEFLTDKMRVTKSNAEFWDSMNS